jgi:5-carboxymethyl-2-hydroxymuconate isomerase
MPHAIIEYSANIADTVETLDITALVHKTMIGSGLFTPSAIKTRSHMSSDFLVGEKLRIGSFLHLSVYFLEGRSAEQKAALSDALIAALQTPLHIVDEVTVDLREMNKETYRKYSAK